MFKLQTEHLFSYSGRLAPPELIGPSAEGARAHFYISGGTFAGPRLNGTLKAVGGDWFCLRRDGIGEVDVRTTIETDDGALIYLSYRGLGDLGEDGYDRFLRNELPPKLPLKTTPTLRTAHPRYQWWHRVFCVGVGEFDSATLSASYDVYALH